MGAFITGIAPVPSREAGGRCRDEGSIAVQIEAVGVTGGTLASVVLDSLTCLRDLKAAIEEAGGPPSRRQELIINGDVQDNLARTLADFLQPLDTNASEVVDNTAGNDSVADNNVDVTQHTNASLEVTVIIVPADENLALISMGASFDGHASLNSKPLLNHDVAFPELRQVPWWEEDDVERAVPASKRQGTAFGRELGQRSQNWNSDCAQSVFLGHDMTVFTIRLGGGAKLAKVGFTYSPWDRNYGRVCNVHAVRRSDASVVLLRRINIPNSHTDRGNPRHHKVQTLMCNTNHHSDIFDAVRFDFLGPSVGRRLYFVYCIGRLVDDD
eukprot:TRINITY_DN17005_c0_g1_i1.p1 TRINITY_DN17005_c0_g1~~TRINITY_DN17005_c0_g1_i1.p1  ORF type:complete len:327 (-),score=40.91 TRINITY_DN17005_c0_g1_i1:12-992(-)